MTQELLSLSRLQKMLKLETCALDRNPRVWLEKLWLMSWMDKNISIVLLEGIFEEIRHVIYESLELSQQEPGKEMRLSKKQL